jgi:hypothetical protein
MTMAPRDFQKIIRDGACDVAFATISKSLGGIIASVDRGTVSTGIAQDQMSDCAEAFLALVDKKYLTLSGEARAHIKDIVVKADRPWLEVGSDRDEAVRRAASTRDNQTFTWDPPPEEDDQEEEPNDNEKGKTHMSAINEAVAKGDKATKADIHKAFVELADELQKSNHKLTAAQAFAKVYEDPANARLRKVYMMVPNAAPAAPSSIVKQQPTDVGWNCLQAKAAELRKAEPKLTREQAFAKVYADPANREFVDLHKRLVAA